MHKIGGQPNIGKGLSMAVTLLSESFVTTAKDNVVIILSKGESVDEMTVPLQVVELMSDVYFLNMGTKNSQLNAISQSVLDTENIFHVESSKILHLQESMAVKMCRKI